MASRRYRQLLNQLVVDLNGNVTAAAKKLGITQPHAHQIRSSNRRASWPIVLRAVEKLGIEPTFFTSEDLGDDPPYRESLHRGPRRQSLVRRAAADPRHWFHRMLEEHRDDGDLVDMVCSELERLGDEDFDRKVADLTIRMVRRLRDAETRLHKQREH